MTMTTKNIENGRVEIHAPEKSCMAHAPPDCFDLARSLRSCRGGATSAPYLKSGILREERVYRGRATADGGIVELYSLEMIAALAFRLKSGNAEAFRRWFVRRATTTAVVWQPPA